MKQSKNKSVRIAPSVQSKKAGFSFSSDGKKVLFAGVIVVVAGFLTVTRTDPAGANWASVLSPFLIIGGYALIGISLIIPQRDARQSDKVSS